MSCFTSFSRVEAVEAVAVEAVAVEAVAVEAVEAVEAVAVEAVAVEAVAVEAVAVEAVEAVEAVAVEAVTCGEIFGLIFNILLAAYFIICCVRSCVCRSVYFLFLNMHISIFE
jgi:hypothetical protein